jgi:tetratricopeptide (TPR) repeat protein
MPAFAGRYLVMAATSWGVSTYHQPDLPRSWLDPWFLAGVGLLALLGWRTLWALRRRRTEAAWWLWAALSFAPISQVFPFIYPMADRYLYFILPGLIGGAILAARDLARGLIPPGSPAAALLARGAAALALAVLAIFAVQSHQRASIWTSGTTLFLDGAKNYPNGIEGSILRALRALGAGDREEAIQALETAHSRGFRVLESLVEDPALRPLHGDPRFQALIREIAEERIERRRAKPNMSLFDMPALAKAHLVVGQFDEAIAVLDRVAALPGSDHPALRAQIEPLRLRAEEGRRRSGG